MKSEETTTKKNSLFAETRVSKEYKTTLTPGQFKTGSMVHRGKPTDQEWFQVYGNTMEDLEEMALFKSPWAIVWKSISLEVPRLFWTRLRTFLKRLNFVR